MIQDAQAREIALDPSKSLIVQAPAGSGKTGLLVYRFLTLLAVVTRPEQILAITFTRKATAEMQQRLIDLLHMAANNNNAKDEFEQQGIELAKKVLAQDKKYGWQLLDAPQQLQIQTIDAFCAKLTSHMPWLSRLGDRPRTTDKADQHYSAAVEQLFQELLTDHSELSLKLQQVMLELDFNYARARKLFSAMLSRRDQWLRHFLQNDLSSMRDQLEQTWSGVCDEHLFFLDELLPTATQSELVNFAIKADLYFEEEYGEPSPFQIFKDWQAGSKLEKVHWLAIRHLLLTSGNLRKPGGINVKLGFPTKDKEHKESFKEMLAQFEGDHVLFGKLDQVQHLPDRNYNDYDWQQLLALESILKNLAALLQLRFRSVGECDHSEVAQRANLALQELENPTDLALRMDYQIDHILVDEFQDTSHGQLQLLRKLTSGWNKQEQNRSLFLVGDPMQSIYRFREADVSLFLQVVNNQQSQIFENIEFESIALSENFRSSAKLVEWFNHVFKKSFPPSDDVLHGAISYVPATHREAQKGASINDYSAVATSLLAHNKDHEAELVVQQTQLALEQIQGEQKIAILVRNRKHLLTILPKLKQAKIDYSAVDIQPLKEKQTIKDVLSLCIAICDQDDRIAWLSLLRGPWCGLSLTQIKHIADRSSETNIWAQICDFDKLEFDQKTKQRLAAFYKVMYQAIQQRQLVGLHSIVRWAWQALGGEYTLDGTAIEDVYELFDLIELHQFGGDISSLKELNQALESLFARPQNTDAKVVISTMHKSKGLQYHTVILPGLSRQTKADEKDVLMWAELQQDNGAQLLLAPIQSISEGQSTHSHYDYLRYLEKQRSQNETVRLMYVACTRAEKKLVLTGEAKLNEKDDTINAPNKSSLLATVWESLQPTFEFDQSTNIEEKQGEQLISQQLARLPGGFAVDYEPTIDWQPVHQLIAKEPSADNQNEFDWASSMATSVGIVMHDWLEFNHQSLFDIQVDQQLLLLWRQKLRFLGVSEERLKTAVNRMREGLTAMQTDDNAKFIFADYEIQKNEYALATFEGGMVNQYRIDRTFV
ncbi:MAG: UvrD-helicase domain-containing protein, partial [Acidiferrobacterales bacterium]|nr:UvrD-helicase domain-containing protein [Acidiferrobacterales bacterium]